MGKLGSGLKNAELLPDMFPNDNQERCYLVGRKQRYILLINLDTEKSYQIFRRKVIQGAEVLGQFVSSFDVRLKADDYFMALDTRDLDPSE